MTLRDEIKKRAEEILYGPRSDYRAKAWYFEKIQKALLERHNKSVEMAARECDDKVHETATHLSDKIRALKEK